MTEEAATVSAPPSAPGYPYDAGFQRNIVALSLRDIGFLRRTEGLIDPSYFENLGDSFLVSVAQGFYAKYRTTPDLASLSNIIRDEMAKRRLSTAQMDEVRAAARAALRLKIVNREYIVDTVADFAKQRAMEDAIIKSVDLVAKGKYGEIEKLIRRAVEVGAHDDMNAYDYFAEIENRTAERKAIVAGTIKPNGITTGFAELDKHLYHGGWGRGELTAIMARAKFGKSMGLGDFAKNAALAGYNVLIVTCENSAKIYADRLDATFSQTAMEVLKHRPTMVETAVKAAEAKSGKLKIHDFPSGSLKPSQLRRLLHRYRSQGIAFDLIVVDYADIMAPEIASGVLREDSRSIWIELRAIAQEENAAVLTATQTNRDGAKAAVATATDVAEDYNKIRTADLVISGNATPAEIKAGKARLHFAASRNQKEITLEIEQDRETMTFVRKILGVMV